MGSCCELECELILSFDLAFIAEATMEEAVAALIEIERMLSGLIKQLVVLPRGRKQRASGSDDSRRKNSVPGAGTDS